MTAEHRVLSPEAETLRQQILQDLIDFGEMTNRPDGVTEWRWFDKMCYQHDMALLRDCGIIG